MALFEEQLVVKKSKIPGAGKGLFTKAIIPKGTKIVEYLGKKSTWKNVDHQGGMNAYIYYVNTNHVIDGSGDPNLARYANDARGATRLPGLSNNCKYYQDYKHRVFSVSVHLQHASKENLVPYGKE